MSKAVLLGVALAACMQVAAPAQIPTVQVPGYGLRTFWSDPTGPSPTCLTMDAQGRIFVGCINGDINVLEDTNGDLIADVVTSFWSGMSIVPPLTGLLWHTGKLYVSHQGKISRIEDTDGDLVGDVYTDLLVGLPTGMHQNNDLFTDGQWLYFGVGSVTDHTSDPDLRSATLMRMAFDGTQPTIWASGLRNTFDGIVHPVTGDIFAGDNGPNSVPGMPNPPDEINRIQQGNHYGHPFEWGTSTTPGLTNPLTELLPHSSPTGMAINTNLALSGYRNEFFLAGFGGGATGGVVKVTCIYGALTGQPALTWEPFVLDLANPIDCLINQEGHLLIAEFSSKRISAVHQWTHAYTVIEGQPSVGMSVPIGFHAPDLPGMSAFALASHDLGTPLPLLPGITWNLELSSPIVALSATPGNAIFSLPFPGTLDAAGSVTGTIQIPAVPALSGLTLQLQFLVVDPSAGFILAASPPQKLTIFPAF